MKNIILIISIIFLITGCKLYLEEESDILINCLPSKSVVQVDEYGKVDDFHFTFSLDSNTERITLKKINVIYESEGTRITTRNIEGNFITLSKLGDTKELKMNPVMGEIFYSLDTYQNITATYFFHFKSISKIENELRTEITITKIKPIEEKSE